MSLAVPLALAGAAQSSVQPRTTAPPPVIDVRVTITDTAIRMAPKQGYRGDLARFIVLNVGKKPHTLTFGGQKRGAGVQTGFKAALKPGQQKILILFLDYRGKVKYYASLPADRTIAAMKGVFTIR